MSAFQYFMTHIDWTNTGLLVICTFLSMLLLYVLLIPLKKTKPVATQATTPSSGKISSQDIKAIAGDDVMTTQLDLARAYLEMGKHQLAKQILHHVVAHGSALQQQEAHELIAKA